MNDHIDRNAQRLFHLLEQAASVKRRIAGLTKEDFLADSDKSELIQYSLMIMGEAVRAMDEAFKAAHPEIPWRSIVGMRNFIVHEYDDIDYDEIWKSASQDLPALTPRLERIYNSFTYPPDFTPPPAPTGN